MGDLFEVSQFRGDATGVIVVTFVFAEPEYVILIVRLPRDENNSNYPHFPFL